MFVQELEGREAGGQENRRLDIVLSTQYPEQCWAGSGPPVCDLRIEYKPFWFFNISFSVLYPFPIRKCEFIAHKQYFNQLIV